MAFAIDLDVGRLQVAMDDALFMCCLHCLGDLLGEREGFLHGEWSARDALGEGFPLDKLHDQKGLAFKFFQAVERRNSRVIQSREQFSFPLETRQLLRVLREFFREEL